MGPKWRTCSLIAAVGKLCPSQQATEGVSKTLGTSQLSGNPRHAKASMQPSIQPRLSAFTKELMVNYVCQNVAAVDAEASTPSKLLTGLMRMV